MPETHFAFFAWFVGPVVAEAMFVNREEIPVYPIYRDPVSWLFFILFLIFSSIHFANSKSRGF